MTMKAESLVLSYFSFMDVRAFDETSTTSLISIQDTPTVSL